MEERSKRDNYRQILLLLIVGSALLIFSSIYLIRTFSIQFGIGAGAYVQANGNVLSQSLQPYVSQLVLNNQYMLESSVETV
ncbi:MAG: hypothetical protein KGH49_03420, partial [Candidatus Micrarchaeota archaeon]|nr:hypothetical protein [Candidatus Micrarchaeota archaeon]